METSYSINQESSSALLARNDNSNDNKTNYQNGELNNDNTDQPQDSHNTENNNNNSNNGNSNNDDNFNNTSNSNEFNPVTIVIDQCQISNSDETTMTTTMTSTTPTTKAEHGQDHQSSGTVQVVNPNVDNPTTDHPNTRIYDKANNEADTTNPSLQASVGNQNKGQSDENESLVPDVETFSREVDKGLNDTEENDGNVGVNLDCDSSKDNENKTEESDETAKNLDHSHYNTDNGETLKGNYDDVDSKGISEKEEESIEDIGTSDNNCDSETVKEKKDVEIKGVTVKDSVNEFGDEQSKFIELERGSQLSLRSVDSELISTFVNEITNKALNSYREEIKKDYIKKEESNLQVEEGEKDVSREDEHTLLNDERSGGIENSDVTLYQGKGEKNEENDGNLFVQNIQKPLEGDPFTEGNIGQSENSPPDDPQSLKDSDYYNSYKEDSDDSLSSSSLPIAPSPPLTSSSPATMNDEDCRPRTRPKSSHPRRRGQQDTDKPPRNTNGHTVDQNENNIRSHSPSIRSQSPSIRSTSPSIRSPSPNIRSPSPNVRSSSPTKRAISPTKRSASPSIRSPSPGELSINLSGDIIKSKKQAATHNKDKDSDDDLSETREQIFHIEHASPTPGECNGVSSPSSDKGVDNSTRNGSVPASPNGEFLSDQHHLDGRQSSMTPSKSPCNDRLNRIADAADNIAGMQDNLQHMFREAKEILTHYQSQLNNQSIVEFSQDVPEFTQAFSGLSDAYRLCENVTGNIDQQLHDIRTATSEICDLITQKTNRENLEDFIQNKESPGRDIESEASHKEQQARLQELKAITAKAAAQAQTAYELAAQAEVKATEADLAATNARKEAEIAMKKIEDAKIAAENKRRKEEEEAKRVAEENARRKKEEEKRRKEEEEMRIALEAESRGTSKEEEMRRYLEEKKRLEAERKNPNNWPRYIYSIEGGDWNSGVGVILRAQQGCLDRDELEITVVDQMDSCFPLGENEELISNILCLKPVDPEKEYKFEEPMSVSIPHCSPRIPPGREPVVKLMTSEGKMSTLSTHDLIFDDIKELKFVEVRLRQFGTMAVFLRSKKEQLTLDRMGGKVMSSVDSRVTITSCENAFRTHASFTMEVQPIDQNLVLELRTKKPDPCGNLMATSPIVAVQMSAKFHKPLTLTLPCPSNPALRPKRPQTASARLAPPPTEKLDPKDRPLSARLFQAKEEPETDEVHLLRKDGGGAWVKVDDVTLTNTKKKDIIAFDLTNPFNKLVLIRTKAGLSSAQVERILSHVITALTFKPVNVIMRQKSSDPNSVTVTCAPSGNVESVIKILGEEGYDHGPKPSSDILLTEGQRLTLRFRGNLILMDDDFSRSDFKFCNHIPFRISFTVTEHDKYAQKGFDSYRGFSQIFTKGKVRRPSMAVDDRDRAMGQKVKDEYVDGDILVCEHLIIIPKPEPETPRPLNVTPVSLSSEGVVNDEMLRFLSTHIQNNDWKRLAAQLNVKRSRIQAILRQNINNSTTQTVYDILVTWSKRLPRAINRTDILCKNLSSIGRDDLAEELRVRDEEYRQAKHLKARESYLRKAFVAIARNPLAVTQWKHLARYLEVDENDIQQIESSHENCQESCLASLIRWKEVRGEEATIPLLANKLRRCRYRRLAREIEDIR